MAEIASSEQDNKDHRPTSRVRAILPIYDAPLDINTAIITPNQQEPNEITSQNNELDTYFSDQKVHIPDEVSLFMK